MFRGPYLRWFNIEGVLVWRRLKCDGTLSWNTDPPLTKDFWRVMDNDNDKTKDRK